MEAYNVKRVHRRRLQTNTHAVIFPGKDSWTATKDYHDVFDKWVAYCTLFATSVGTEAPQKFRTHIDASHSRQPLVKGERLVRHEVNAVMISRFFRPVYFFPTAGCVGAQRAGSGGQGGWLGQLWTESRRSAGGSVEQRGDRGV